MKAATDVTAFIVLVRRARCDTAHAAHQYEEYTVTSSMLHQLVAVPVCVIRM